jgi:hypothetical protein
MFCPTCGNESQDGQKFCKACGVNLQTVSDALGREQDSLGPIKVDVEALKQRGRSLAADLKESMRSVVINRGSRGSEGAWDNYERYGRRKAKEWLSYSWQHNLRNGLISLFTGAGLGFVWYYLARIAIDSGTIRSIDEITHHHIDGVETLVSMLWLFAAIPVLKGLAQLIYAAFFAESIATLSQRFMPAEPQPPVYSARSESGRDTNSGLGERFSAPSFEGDNPSSVTEHTTKIFAERRANRETQ